MSVIPSLERQTVWERAEGRGKERRAVCPRGRGPRGSPLTRMPGSVKARGPEPRGAVPARGSRASQALADHVREQVDAAVRVAPLVVVPAHELEEVAVELDRRARVVDARPRIVDEVGGDDLILGVA